VTVQVRPDGTQLHVSAAFLKADRFPSRSDPEGVLVTAAAAALLGELRLDTAPVRAGVAHVVRMPEVEDATRFSARIEPLVGRDHVVQQLVDRARAAIDRQTPTITTVLGEAGCGKSHLSLALLERLRGAPQLIALGAHEPVAGDLDRTFRALVERALQLPPQRPDDAGRRAIVERLGSPLGDELWAAVALALDWLPEDAPELHALAVAPGALRSAAARAVGAALRSAEHGTIVVIDDAQYAGAAVLDALEYATLSEARAPLWVCVLARPGFEQLRPGWGERAGARDEVRLGALEPANAGELCRRLLLPAHNIPAAAIENLVQRTQGNPLLIVELVRALKAQGLVRRHAKGDSWYLVTDELERLPDLALVEWLARRELDALAPTLAAHARLVALLGDGLAVSELAGVLRELDREGHASEYPLDAAVGARRLVVEGLLTDRGGRIGFVHALVRTAVYQSIPEALRRPVHLAALRYYSAAPHDAESLARIALHAARAGQRERALGAYLELAERARARHDYFAAETLYSEAIAHTIATDDAQQMTALRGRGLMRYRLGRYEDSLADFDRAREVAVARGDAQAHCEILLDAATALDWSDEYRRSSDLVDQASGIADAVGSPHVEARLLMGLARSAFRFDRNAEAADLFARAAASAERLGDAGYETLVISLLLDGYILAQLGRLDDSERAFERVIPMCEQHGDQLHLGAAVGNRSMLWICRNDETRLIADLERLLAIGRELGNGRMEQQGHFYMALFLHWLGRSSQAEHHARRAVEIDDRRYGDAARPESALLLARVAAGAGDAATSRAMIDGVRARQARARERGDRELALLPSEEIQLAMVELATQAATDAAWDELAARARGVLTGHDLTELLLVRASRTGSQVVAREILSEAAAIAAAAPNVMRARIDRELGRLVP
jgi:eukaryotic-like serine/threonine-protein kinase